MAERLTDEKKKLIIAEYVVCQNYSEVARKYGLSPNGVKKIVLNDPVSAAKCEQKQEENTQDTLAFLQEQHSLKKELLFDLLKAMGEKAKKPDMFTSIKDLAFAYGIVFDKEMKYLETMGNGRSGDEKEDDPLSASLKELALEIDNDEV